MQYKSLFIFRVIFFLLVSAEDVPAQYERFLDSLKNDLANTKNDTSRASKLNILSYAALDPKEQLDYAQRALAISEKTGYKKGQGDALNNIGYVYQNEGEIAKAMEIEVAPQAGRTYTIRFVGKNGKVLVEQPVASARYEFKGDELYVRAVVVDSSQKKAWIQPRFIKP